MATSTPDKQAPMYYGHSPVSSPLIDQISANQTTPIPPPPLGKSYASNSQQPTPTPTTAVIPTTQPEKQKGKRKSYFGIFRTPTGTPKPRKKDTKLSDEVMYSFKDHTLHQL
ncbi:hypothetical protein PGTUg99_032674 [Puccinia graminis f. sp. tritici]|uniref:Uncharacterized protein n=1 Tax=Puccinia graminis f. sp. tritici TaxID=56615 RepID=A0A5B0PLT2_PUCGR|nr:hypothetical protein PGTUg99_032674 [Puccinia graminis f. sp. tritici]